MKTKTPLNVVKAVQALEQAHARRVKAQERRGAAEARLLDARDAEERATTLEREAFYALVEVTPGRPQNHLIGETLFRLQAGEVRAERVGVLK